MTVHPNRGRSGQPASGAHLPAAGRRFPWWGAAGAALFVAGLWSLAADLEVANALWYIPAWYGYLLVVDAAVHRRRGESLLGHRRREAGAMLAWSVPFWLLFESYNLVLRNWYYVFGLRVEWVSELLTAVAFATVLPACFFHAELLAALGFGERLRWRPLPVGGTVEALFWALGALAVATPLAWPRLAFPLVWMAPLFIPDLLARRLGAPSLLADLEAGRPGRLLRLVAAGLWAGVVWELFNFWARSKWIYTVPGFEHWKLFEMPLLGFGGFPVLALAAFSSYSLFCHLVRGGRHWEAPPPPARPVPRLRWAAAALLAAAGSLAALEGIERWTVRSHRPLLVELAGLDRPAAARLRAAGIPTPERLWTAARRQPLEPLAARAGLERGRLEAAVRHAGLALHKGMGTGAAALLLAAGVDGPQALARADPADLHPRLAALAAAAGTPPPRPAEVRVWVRAARLFGGYHR